MQKASRFSGWHCCCLASLNKTFFWGGLLSASQEIKPFHEIICMLSRKEFFKNLLFRGVRAVNDLTGEIGGRSSEHDKPGQGSDLPATELSPSLLAIEAEIRGIDLQDDRTVELRRAIYEKLAQNSPT
jgi:hypothetical protein